MQITSDDCIYSDILNGAGANQICPGHPLYSSNLIFELYINNANGNHIIKVKYNDVEYSPCNNGLNQCSWNEF